MGQALEEHEDDWDLVARLAADLHDAHARLVDLMATVITEGTWEGRGLRSPEHFLVLRAGLSQGQARAIVLLARRACELPETSRALREGRISLDQAAVVARHTPAEFDTTVAEFAQHATVPQLQRSVAKYDFPRAPDAEGGTTEGARPWAPEPDEPPSLTMHHADGRFTLRYDAPSELGALVETALAEAKDWLFQQRSGGDSESGTDERGDLAPHAATSDRFRVTWADALAVLANRSLEGVEVAGRRGKYRINVFLDTDGGWLAGRPRLPRHVLDGLTCDGQLVPVWTTEGVPVNVGRSHRVVPERTRRLVTDRDRGCRFPGCAATAFVEVHHLVHWADGGLTDLDNLLSLCPFHHDSHHRREFTISGEPTRDDGLVFRSSRGLLIGPPGRGRPSGGAPPHLTVVRDSTSDPGPTGHTTADPTTAAPAAMTAKPTGHTTADPTTATLAGAPAGTGLGRETEPQRRVRPVPRTDRTYAAPVGHPLHVALVDFTPYPPPDAWRHTDA